MEPLTGRELAVLRLLTRGLTYGAAARRLGVSINTVRTHVRSLYSKLGARSKTVAVVRALQLGLVDPGRRPERH